MTLDGDVVLELDLGDVTLGLAGHSGVESLRATEGGELTLSGGTLDESGPLSDPEWFTRVAVDWLLEEEELPTIVWSETEYTSYYQPQALYQIRGALFCKGEVINTQQLLLAVI